MSNMIILADHLKTWILVTMYICEYCNNNFTTADILRKHQLKAKYCLRLQGKLEKDNKPYECQYCESTFTRSNNLRRHEKSCVKKPLDTNANLLEHILQALAKNPSMSNITNNNRNMNLAPITDDLVEKDLDRLTIDIIREGGKGYAGHAGHYPYKDRIICTDKARHKLRWRDENDNLINDAKGAKITQKFFQAISIRNEELITAEYSNLQQQVHDIAETQTAANSNLVEILQRSIFLQELLDKCRQAADGKENDMTKEFVRHLARMCY